ncbi:MAG: hypothetical protein PWR27_179 [Petroclostridium sp.]|uniref:spermine/spermidine synthase domain-containing protein n=1 Tax=Petroclostridium xylanilyticum TaxID=1792311 RepID=UPI0018E3BB2E|nr:hypothetical protein [Petroclostridium xylanilyticum]MDK2809470.1 hypothetical protein [Petroclostridium sp.]
MLKVRNSGDKILVLLSVFFVSISLFVYQVVLTRIYSAILWYHYVFLITSFAVFGLGIGGIIAYRQQEKRRANKAEPKRKAVPDADVPPIQSLYKALVVLSISYISVLGIVYILPYINGLLVYAVLGTIPFILGGYYFSVLFRELSGISNRLYFADLLGSGLGSIIVLLSLNYLGMYRSVILICVIASLAALLFAIFLKRKSAVNYILPVIFLAGLLIPGQYVNFIEQNFNGFTTNVTKTLGKIEKAGEKGKIVYTKWNAFSRTDVIKVEEDPDQMLVTIDGAANAPMYRFDGNTESLNKYKKDTEYMPFSFGKNDSTLIIGPGGGRDVLYALAGGSKDITAVEINTSSIDAVRHFKDYNGNIYDRPEVRVYGEDGRNYIRKTKDKYDVIFLSLVMTSTSQGAGYALSENYIYTVEAMQDYLDHLKEDGKLAFLTHDQEDLGKIVATAILALKNKGIPVKDAPKYMAIFKKNMPQSQHGGEHIHNPMVIIKNTPFTQEQSKELAQKAVENGNIPLFTPHIYEQGPLGHIKEEHISMAEYLTGFSYNVTPATDDSPYFYNFTKGISPILLFILSAVIVGGMVLFIPYVAQHGASRPALYFSGLGAGFMLIEIPLIQKFILYLGHPVLAFTYVLAALLIGCGLGAFMSSSKLFNRTIKNVYMPPVLIVIINMILIGILGGVFKNTSDWSLVNRILISSIIVMIQGFFMGMPFPRGLKLLSESGRSDIIPVMWGINGVMSVVGSVLSIILSMEFGFNGALIAGGIAYILVSLQNKI